ncbi:Heterokaryon incompatibility [Apiospora phragmitis]|uniref:Heterokaryon incompatibility n=1 Tax=Apiospora phragmitis TaxID=2905665 RepID=A0ABR1WSY4_9PEZI
MAITYHISHITPQYKFHYTKQKKPWLRRVGNWDVNQFDVALLRSWISHCDTVHRRYAVYLIDFEFLTWLTSTSVNPIEAVRYVALSYMWEGGGEQEFQLRQNLVETLEIPSSLAKITIPGILKDAMALCKDLNESTWVDWAHRAPPTVVHYCRWVEEYTRRQLTFPSDSLNAFAGASKIVASALEIRSSYELRKLDVEERWIDQSVSMADLKGVADLPVLEGVADWKHDIKNEAWAHRPQSPWEAVAHGDLDADACGIAATLPGCLVFNTTVASAGQGFDLGDCRETAVCGFSDGSA